MCLLCAAHEKTGEIGLIKLVQMDHYKGGERITMLAGDRALKDYGEKEKISRKSRRFCAQRRMRRLRPLHA